MAAQDSDDEEYRQYLQRSQAGKKAAAERRSAAAAAADLNDESSDEEDDMVQLPSLSKKSRHSSSTQKQKRAPAPAPAPAPANEMPPLSQKHLQQQCPYNPHAYVPGASQLPPREWGDGGTYMMQQHMRIQQMGSPFGTLAAPPAPVPPAPVPLQASQGEAPASEPKKKKTGRKVYQLPEKLQGFTYADKDQMKISEVMDPKLKTNVFIATQITTEEGETFELKTLMLDSLRKLCVNFGCKAQQNKHECLKAMAQRKTMGPIYDGSAPSPATTAAMRSINSAIRDLNALFKAKNIGGFLDINKRLQRDDFEGLVQESNNNPVKVFWRGVSEDRNNTEDTELDVIMHADTDPVMRRLKEDMKCNPRDFNPGTYQTLQVTIRDLIKCRNRGVQKSKETGRHNPDFIKYLHGDYVLKPRKSGPRYAKEVVYYFHLLAKEYPAIDQSHATFLNKGLFGETEDSDAETDNEGDSKKKDGRGSKKNKEFQDALDKANENSTGHMKELIAERKKSAKVQEARHNEMMSTQYWEEYSRLGQLIKGLNGRLYMNMSKRVRQLEKQLGIKENESILYDDNDEDDGQSQCSSQGDPRSLSR